MWFTIGFTCGFLTACGVFYLLLKMIAEEPWWDEHEEHYNRRTGSGS